VDVMPSALAALGLGIPAGLDGVSFLDRARNSPSHLTRDAHLAHEQPDDERGAESAVA
jgi:hypothetical protein